MDNVQKTLLQIITHHRQNPLDFILTFILCNFLQKHFWTNVHRTILTHLHILNLAYHLWHII
jgi:hypothetical protein